MEAMRNTAPAANTCGSQYRPFSSCRFLYSYRDPSLCSDQNRGMKIPNRLWVA